VTRSKLQVRHLAAVLGLALSVAGPTAAVLAGDAPRPLKRLIELGWDEPDTEFMRAHIAEMERAPFDGCVFHVNATSAFGVKENFAWLAWGRHGFSEDELEPALDDLKATRFRRFTHNFLRIITAPADIDWFDDHSAIMDNLRFAGRLAREGRCAGILFDVEEYQGKLFTYSEQQDAKTKSYGEYAAQVRRRGREAIDALQQGYPGVTVLLTFGYSLPSTKSGAGKKPLSETRYGLLAPFLDGLVDGARGKTRLIDGYELSYGYREKSQFDAAYRQMKEGALPIVAAPARYSAVFSSGFGLWLDNDWRTNGWNEADPSRNYFTPRAFEATLRAALERSDEYVWVYSETPRWWSPMGGRVKLPDAYERAIRAARAGLCAE
jgi:hypothetical protein